VFDERHYVPVLRWKRGERGALRELTDGVKQRTTPLIELPSSLFTLDYEPSNQNTRSMLINVSGDIERAWGKRRAFCDLGLIPPSAEAIGGQHPVTLLWEYARRKKLNLVPTISLRSSARYLAATFRVIEHDRAGACIRLSVAQLHSSHLRSDLSRLMNEGRLRPDEVDLTIDRGIIYEQSVRIPQMLVRVPDIGAWRSLTVLGGSFPKNLTGFSVGQHLRPRLEWRSWLQEALNQDRAARRPTFGDYTTQHPVYREPPKRANFSASIRYTTKEDWVVMRGEGVFNDDSAGYAQWPANATLLCERKEFCGPQFSAGDAYIVLRTKRGASNGNAETWLQAGVNHHMTFAVRQIAKLAG